ncbi:MAG: amidohydrolase family protein [Acidobacteria bacterium]|nr:amidohydrolase family protein [Acidobacteriota bacterium]
MPASTRFARRPALFTLLSLFLFSSISLSHNGVRHDYRLAGGKWFDGKTFVERTVYSVGGVLRDAWDGPVEATLDLSGTFVVAPYADVHTHDLGGGSDAEGRIKERLRQGVFYLKNTNSVPRWAAPFKPLVNRPESVDVAWANGGLTAAGGHPIQIYENVVARPPVPDWTKADLPDQAYVVVDDAAALDAKWPKILAGKPDFLKIYLEHSEEFAKRKDDPAFFGRKGLDPALVPAIVAKAHAAGLRVTAHARTAADFRAALAGGVDEFAHLPLARLTAEDARRCVERKVTVVTTTLGHWDREGIADVDAIHRENLALLKAAGVTVVFGVDGHPPLLAEVENVRRMGVFDDAALLRMLASDGPRAVFPKRKIGCLSEGCEASFLALEANPLEDFAALKKIRTRMKEGLVLRGVDGAAPAAAPPHG